MYSANNYFIASQNGNSGDCGWERGTYFTGCMAHIATTCKLQACNSTLLNWAQQWAAGHNFSCAGSENANDEVCGQSYVELYDYKPTPQGLNLQYTLSKQMGSVNGSQFMTWVDALYMAAPTYARYGVALQNSSYWDFLYKAYTFTAYQLAGPGLWSPKYNLFYRDPTYFNKTSPNGAPVFWARGCGWAIAAMARVIAALPAGHPTRGEYVARLQAMAPALAAVQGADGLWRASLLDANEYPNPESTGTGMFTYALAWGVNNGLLDAATYTPIVLKAWQGLSTISLQPSGLVGWCQPPNGQPAPAKITDTSDFCVGQFLLAGSEVAKLVAAMQ